MDTNVIRLDPAVADEAAALIACEALCDAYAGGRDSHSIDWSDLDTAVCLAFDAVPGTRETIETAREKLDYERFDEICLTWSGAPTAVHACFLLFHAYRNEEETEWSDVDDAYVVAKRAIRNAKRAAKRALAA